MDEAFAYVGADTIVSAELHVPRYGAWFADVVFASAPSVAGRVTLVIGDLSLSGTVDARFDGTRGEQRMARIVAGAGGWGTLCAAKSYHADNGVSALVVAQDAALAAGETLGTFAPSSATVGVDYARGVTSAGSVLSDALGSASWWIGYDGVTQVGARAEAAVAGAYTVLDYDPRNRVVTIESEALSTIAAPELDVANETVTGSQT